MSLYSSSSVRTNILDPVFFRANHRAEFRLPSDTYVLSNMRLVNIGAIADTATAYNGLGGSASTIESIILMDGNVLLDQVLEMPIKNAFNQFNNTSQRAKDMLPGNTQSKFGLNYSGALNDSTPANEPKLRLWNVKNTDINTTEATTETSRIALQELLPFLQNMFLINTQVFKNLRLVINYNTDVSQYAANAAVANPTSVQPQLIFDESDTPLQPPQDFEFDMIEHDRFQVPSGAGLVSAGNTKAVQPVSNRLNGFENKFVKRVLLVKTPLLATTYQATPNNNNRYGPLGSKSFLNEVFQVRLNGSNMFPGNGINNENQRLSSVVDTFGNCALYPFGNGNAFLNGATDYDRTSVLLDGNTIISELDYYAVRINQSVADLSIEFSREVNWVDDTGGTGAQAATNGASMNQPFMMNAFAEVRKAINFNSDGSYTVTYV